MSDRTKQCKTLMIIFGILHFLCLFGPILYFVPYGFIVGEAVSKITLGFSVITSLCLAVIMLFADAAVRGGLTKTIMWLLVLGVVICLAEVKAFIIIMAAVSIIDELVITKLHARYKDAYAANREIDRRL